METGTARSFVNVDKNALASIQVTKNINYAFSYELTKDNVLLGMIATKGPLSANNSAIAYRIFSEQGNNTFSWRNEGEFTDLHFFMLMKFQEVDTGTPSRKTYIIGPGDGAVEDIPAGYAAKINIDYWSTTSGIGISRGADVEKVVLPAELVEFASGFQISVSPVADPNLGLGNIISLSVEKAGESDLIEIKTNIHVISGTDGYELLAVVTPEADEMAYFQLGEINTINNNVNIVAFVAPTIEDTSKPWEFTFELGDPEKDGSVGIRVIP
jgi:hypothetical protein